MIPKARALRLPDIVLRHALTHPTGMLTVPMAEQLPDELPKGYYFDQYHTGPQWNFWTADDRVSNSLPFVTCPFLVGETRWVQEAWRVGAVDGDRGCIAIDYRADGHARREWLRVEDNDRFLRLWEDISRDASAGGYTRADGSFSWEPGQGPGRWRSASTLSQPWSRLAVQITAIRGHRRDLFTESDYGQLLTTEGWLPSVALDLAWDLAYAGRGLSCAARPWVWTVGYTVVVPEVRA
jgi:hypothetical protein